MSPSDLHAVRRKASEPSNTDEENTYPSSSFSQSLRNLTELGAPAPIDDPDEEPIAHREYLEEAEEEEQEAEKIASHDGRRASHISSQLPNISETVPFDIVENPREDRHFTHHNLEEERSGEGQRRRSSLRSSQRKKSSHSTTRKSHHRIRDEVFIFGHLIFFSLLGTLARIELGTLTTFDAGPIYFANSLWSNFTGTLILGFLSEGSELLHHPKAKRSISRIDSLSKTKKEKTDELDSDGSGGNHSNGHSSADSSKTVAPAFMPVPLHLGLASGFCGSFTTFSTFMLDSFLALAGIASPTATELHLTPSPGRDFMSVAAVLLITISLSVVGLKAGAHAAIYLISFGRRFPRRVVRWLDYIFPLLGLLGWISSVVLAIVLRSRGGPLPFALAFAPLGCLLRFMLSLHLNSRIVGFPLGTFAANMTGTLVLAVAWDLQRLPDPTKNNMTARIGSNVISCQVLQGVQDGFCGCTTTVSTWILELSGLRRRHAYRYGLSTVAAGLAIMVVILGSTKWTIGLAQPLCVKS
ncbi:CrcB-like protein-domain-containing protein [Xylariaceae sp. FL0255]|nr:CrcB-like protein-domain-containing protein [Xylariaceae sp. FL0255]